MGMLVGTYGLQFTSPAAFPDRQTGSQEPGLPDRKLVQNTQHLVAKEIEGHQAMGNRAGAYWAEYGRLPTGLLSPDDRALEPIYLFQRSMWVQEPTSKEYSVMYGDRYDVTTLSSIPSGLSAQGETYSQRPLDEQDQASIERMILEIHQLRQEVRDGRSCSSKDNCFGLPTYVCFLPLICCLGGCCYDQYKQKKIVSKVKEVTEEHLDQVNAQLFQPRALKVVAVTSTYHTLQFVTRNEIRQSQSEHSVDQFRNITVSKWEMTPITLRWLEIRPLDSTSALTGSTLPAPVLPSWFGSADPKTDKQLPIFQDKTPVTDLKQMDIKRCDAKEYFV